MKKSISLLLLLLSLNIFGEEVCFTPEPTLPNSRLPQSCNDENVRVNQQHFLPFSDDPNKVVKLRFIFLQKEGDEANGVGGFHLSNPTHSAYWQDIVDFMNWRMEMMTDQSQGGNCSDPSEDTKIRFDVEMTNIADDGYWNYFGQAGPSDTHCSSFLGPLCPTSGNWYLRPLHNMINNSNSDKRINVFFTESEPAYNLALNGQLYPNNEGSFCKIACAIYPRPAHEPPGEVIWQLI